MSKVNGEKIAKVLNCQFIETSSANGLNTEMVFLNLVKCLLSIQYCVIVTDCW